MTPCHDLDPRVLSFIVQGYGSGGAKAGGHGEGKRKNQHVTSPIVLELTKSYADRSTTKNLVQNRVLGADLPRFPCSGKGIEPWFRNMLKKLQK